MEPQQQTPTSNPDNKPPHPTPEQTDRTVQYLKQMLTDNKDLLFKFSSNHIMIYYFALEALDVLGRIGDIGQLRPQLIDYIYSLQLPNGGFTCSSLHVPIKPSAYDLPHIVFTYSAMNCLAILGDDFKRLNKQNLLESVQRCQKPDGSFSSFANSDEADLRFVYAAVAICSMAGDLSPINKQKSIEYIQRCFSFDGGIGLRPGNQSHCGAVYCAVSVCKLLGVLEILEKDEIIHFLVSRQSFNLECPKLVGVQGRVGKLPDSCYSFWAGASICILTGKNLLNSDITNFLEICYTQSGSYSKMPQMHKGDPLHTLHTLVGTRIVMNKYGGLSLERGIKTEKIPHINQPIKNA